MLAAGSCALSSKHCFMSPVFCVATAQTAECALVSEPGGACAPTLVVDRVFAMVSSRCEPAASTYTQQHTHLQIQLKHAQHNEICRLRPRRSAAGAAARMARRPWPESIGCSMLALTGACAVAWRACARPGTPLRCPPVYNAPFAMHASVHTPGRSS